ncbi:MAG: gliding motility-associated C-terminal domain-containing protein [Sphingobacteriales bacterium]|nr:MAG: gliding motility-associated C-terminal domain-containing protein [Sphingobacteriales bacterium]
MATTNYSLISIWGRNCISQKQVTIPVTPLAVPFAGSDTAYCLGSAGVGLQASGGTSYQWSPTTGLSNAGVANPVATPLVPTNYVVAVGVDGCSKRKMDTVRVLPRQKPQLQLTNDTLICIIDTLRLNAAGAGTIRWTPDYNINSLTSHTPLVSPDTPTKYFVRLTDIFRCFKEDSVFVDVRPDVTVDAGPDTTICKGDTMHLATTGDAVSYSWTPFRAISDTTAKNPVVKPDTTTTYVVRANIGKCEKQSRVTIRVVPYPVAVAEPDTTLCSGFSTRLQASGGSIYSWWPETYLSNPAVANPMVVTPAQTRLYTVTVTDTLGCPKPVKDSVLVSVIPPLNVRIPYNDTALVDGQSIVLAVSGAVSYQWSPNQWLSSSIIPNPTAKPRDNIVYHVVGSDENGCMARDSISITLYDIPYGMHVPTAFTPNGDGNNDIARPILLGMKSLSYFNIFNRFGQLVFSTTEQGKGWDGIYKGKPQDPATFVWMAEGVSFKGEKITRKGYVVLIR